MWSLAALGTHDGGPCQTRRLRLDSKPRRSLVLRIPPRSPRAGASGAPLIYSHDDVKALTDKVLNMAKADAAEVDFSGGERSATRFANSNITANIVQFDQSLTLTVYN